MVAQEPGHGVREDELYAGTPSLATMKLFLAWYTCMVPEDNSIMIVDVESAFLYGAARRTIYIELPEQDPYSGKNLVGRLGKSMYGTRDAPLIWRALVDETMGNLGFERSMLQPGVYVHGTKGLRAMIHVDDFMVIGPTEECK